MSVPVDVEREAAALERGERSLDAALSSLSPARRDLFETNRVLVEAIARYEVPRLRRRVDEDDLTQAGWIGLWKACATFDAEVARLGGRTFAQWAKPLIRWAMRKAVRSQVRYEKWVLRSSQESASAQVLYCARAAHPFDDDDESVRGLTARAASGAMGAMAVCLAGSLLRAPGEEGVVLRVEHARLLAAVAEERARLDPEADWVLARKYEDGMTWKEMQAIAGGRTIAQLRYIHDKAIAALGEALRARGHATMPVT